jgi:hypothetical protein
VTVQSDDEARPAESSPDATADESYEQWLARSRAFHDEERRKFYEARARTLAAIEHLRRLAERRRQ